MIDYFFHLQVVTKYVYYRYFRSSVKSYQCPFLSAANAVEPLILKDGYRQPRSLKQDYLQFTSVDTVI